MLEHMTEHPVPRWATRLAHLIPFMTLPSGLWRLGLLTGSSLGMLDENRQPIKVTSDGEFVWILFLSLSSRLSR
jgi:hypothetical protein